MELCHFDTVAQQGSRVLGNMTTVTLPNLARVVQTTVAVHYNTLHIGPEVHTESGPLFCPSVGSVKTQTCPLVPL